MRPVPITIRFGEKDLTIRPLTLAQIRDMERALAKKNVAPGETTELAMDLFAIALRRDHPDVKVEDLETPVNGIDRAFETLFIFAGFKKAEPSGEGEAAPSEIASGA